VRLFGDPTGTRVALTRPLFDAGLSIYNPTATPAVFNIVTYSPSGYSAPPLSGLAWSHDQTVINLVARL